MSMIDADAIVSDLQEMLKKLAAVSPLGDDCGGGMFCLMEESTGRLVIEPIMIGQITNGKGERYLELCLEKANRLRNQRLVGSDHVLSWQSRDPDKDMWGGAILDDVAVIWSCSGLTEAQDEALMTMGAHNNGRIMNGVPEIYARISSNDIILKNEPLFWRN
jgi:hypothetical protein